MSLSSIRTKVKTCRSASDHNIKTLFKTLARSHAHEYLTLGWWRGPKGRGKLYSAMVPEKRAEHVKIYSRETRSDLKEKLFAPRMLRLFSASWLQLEKSFPLNLLFCQYIFYLLPFLGQPWRCFIYDSLRKCCAICYQTKHFWAGVVRGWKIYYSDFLWALVVYGFECLALPTSVFIWFPPPCNSNKHQASGKNKSIAILFVYLQFPHLITANEIANINLRCFFRNARRWLSSLNKTNIKD